MDWFVVLEARAPDGEGGILEVIDTDEEGAIEALEGWAETIENTGMVPEGLEWRNRAPCAVLRRAGKKRFGVRCDTFETETSEGHGWLLVREA